MKYSCKQQLLGESTKNTISNLHLII